MVRVDALPASAGDPDAVDVRQIADRAVIARTDAGEELLLRVGACDLRLSAREGTFDQVPVRFRYILEGLQTLDAKLGTLQRLLALCRHGRLPKALHPDETKAERWILMLRALDAAAAGATQREIAEALFGSQRTQADWRRQSDYLRLRVQRLLRQGRRISKRDYRLLLRGAPIGD